MKKAKVIRVAIIVLIAVLTVSLAEPLVSHADFGNFSGGSDYGGGSSFGGGDYDDGGDFATLIFYLIFSMLPWPIKVILIIILVIMYFFSRFGRLRGSNTPKRVAPVTPTRSSGIGLSPISDYNRLDPTFSSHALTQKLSNLYVQMQNCWTNKDITPLRPYFTDAQFAQYDMQLKEIIKSHTTNHIERIAVLSVTLNGFFQSGGFDHIIAEISTRITTYTTDDNTGKVIRGSKNAEVFMTYEWDLVRPSGQTSEKSKDVKTIGCPNCGAPIDINASAKCPYCDSVITLANHDFVIYSIKGLSQRTVN